MHSSVLRNKLQRWTGAERPMRIEVELDDEADVPVFEDVLWGMYQVKLPAENMTVERALAIARLADAYFDETVLCAATAWINEQASLTWDDALRVCEAPVSVRDRLDLRKAQTTMLGRQGTWNDDRLAVAAESTVVALTMQWAEQHKLATVPDAVACCIRLKHLQCGYIAGVTRWFPQWTVEVVALLSAGQASPAAWSDVRQMENSPQAL
ncbi:hypothetical protein JKP88DRAFT_283272 [Tribonema minus]|uniref:Uncharacterized protein n=1 Tax=Tribonema minus TaxID=303371 RepID=A0A835YI31_9STRA|nr:hypothetical protein JKP88DRAFT_283272 [Tribonema minus]